MSEHIAASLPVAPIPRASTRRLTRADIPNLPKNFLKGIDPAMLNMVFDEEGFMLPRVQAEVERLLVSQHCFVCGKASKHKCSRCKRISYCSADCQRTHWQAHKPDCLRVTDPINYINNCSKSPQEDAATFTLIMSLGDDMHKRGRHFRNIRVMLDRWLLHIKYFGELTLTFDGKTSYAIVLVRGTDGRLSIFEEIKQKSGYDRPGTDMRKAKKPEQHAQQNVPAYIAKTIERGAKDNHPTPLRVYLYNTLVPINGETCVKHDNECERRGAGCAYMPDTNKWSVIQWEPEAFRRFETGFNEEGYRYRHYVW